MKRLMHTLCWTDAAYSWSVGWQTAKLVAVHKSRLRVRPSRSCGAQAARSTDCAKAGLGGETTFHSVVIRENQQGKIASSYLVLPFAVAITCVHCCHNRTGRDTEADEGSEEEREVSDLGELLHRKKYRRIAQDQDRKEQEGTQSHRAVPVPEPEHQAQHEGQ